MNDHPWYMRTEFWAMAVGFGLNIGISMGIIDPDTAATLQQATTSPEAAGTYVAAQGQGWMLLVLNFPIVAYIIGRSMTKTGKSKTQPPTK